MPVQRFLPDVDRTRLRAGWFLIVIFALPSAWLASLILAGDPNGSAIVLFLICGGMLALGARFAFWPVKYLELDLEARTFSLIRKGQRGAVGPIDSLGPLEVRRRSRVVGTGSKRRTVIEYVVIGAAHSDIDLYSRKSAGKARQKMEDLARAWDLPCKSLGGAVRAKGALDTPLHERLRGDGAARKPASLVPGWGVRVEPLSPGYAVVSTHRSYEPLFTVGGILIVGLFVLRVPLRDASFLGEIATGVREGEPTAVVVSLMVSIALLLTFRHLGINLRDTFFPGTVRITDEGLSYRGQTMRFAQIEEVTATYPIEIVGDRRILTLAATFCPIPAAEAVAHELQRLILDVAATSPDAA